VSEPESHLLASSSRAEPVACLAMRIAAAGAVALVALALVGCASEERRLGADRSRASPTIAPAGVALTVSGAVEGELKPEGPPSCSPATVALYGTIGGEKFSLTVFAPFANFPGGQTIDLPPSPTLDAGIRLNGLRAGPWLAGAAGGSGRITVAANLQSGTFDADLVAADGSRAHATGTWVCTTGGPVATAPLSSTP
jgi:hypothetical protein